MPSLLLRLYFIEKRQSDKTNHSDSDEDVICCCSKWHRFVNMLAQSANRTKTSLWADPLIPAATEEGRGVGGSVPGRWPRRVGEEDLSKATYPDSLVASLQWATMGGEGAWQKQTGLIWVLENESGQKWGEPNDKNMLVQTLFAWLQMIYQYFQPSVKSDTL